MDRAQLDDALVGERVAVEEIPLIALEPLLQGELAERTRVAVAIGRACRDIGFFYVTGHAIPADIQQRAFALAVDFFARPVEEKAVISIDRSPCHRGWFRLGGENLDPAEQTSDGDLKEGVKIGQDLPADHALVRAGIPLHGPNQWPAEPAEFVPTMRELYALLANLGRQLMRAFALALGLPEGWFDPVLTRPMATLGPLHYPPQTGRVTAQRLGAGAHTDFGCLTILAQDDVGGLQVRNAAGRWLSAPPIPGTFVVNVGDMMARWTNDLFASTVHRVVNASGRDRYSMPFFFDPNHDAEISCLATCQSTDNPPRYPRTTGLQHLLDRIDATFAYRHLPAGG